MYVCAADVSELLPYYRRDVWDGDRHDRPTLVILASRLSFEPPPLDPFFLLLPPQHIAHQRAAVNYWVF